MQILLPCLWLFFLLAAAEVQADVPLSEVTEECLGCHAEIYPGIVAEWRKSRHAKVSPEAALKKSTLERRVSAEQVPENLSSKVVGCAECHTMNPEKHKDTFEHNGYRVHVVVTPEDCSTCHPVEREQYAQNLMSHAYLNLKDNPLYHNLADTINGIQVFSDMTTTLQPPDPKTEAESCYYCHGNEVTVKGSETRETDFGEMAFPILSGWPNQGVGRLNPDDSMGACTSCHTRHAFSIEMARKPHTCSGCHKGPDVPAYPVYGVSKHGNIYSSLGNSWDFQAVPWHVGKDFTAPTCAVCHLSLIAAEGDEVVVERTHQMSDRLPWRIFGLIYAHPHPKSPDTTIILNHAGLPLPTELTGERVEEYLIDAQEQNKRLQTMKKVCSACHSRQWFEGHFERFEHTIKTTNEMTLTATKIILKAWEKRVARGPQERDSIFNEAIEKKWMEQWLFYGNSTRFASAMAGADYGVFANGRWEMAQNIQELLDGLKILLKTHKLPARIDPDVEGR